MLGQYLIKNGKISEEQLASALERQTIMGGRLGTNLVELKILSENDFIECLSQHFNMPPLQSQDLENLDLTLTELISKEVSEKYQIVPFKKERTTLHVAYQNKENLKVTDDLQFITGCNIRSYVASETQIMKAQEVLYQIKRPLRFISSIHGETQEDKEVKRNTPWVRKELTPMEMEKTLQEGRMALANAENREEALGTLLKMAHAVIERGILFLAKNGNMTGYKGFPEFRNPEIEKLSFKISDLPVFNNLIQNHTPYHGLLPDEPCYKDISEFFDGTPPHEVVLFPLTLNGNVVSILFGEKHGSTIPDSCLDFLKKSTEKTSMAFEILVLKNKIMEM